jgi:hypothetical protein
MSAQTTIDRRVQATNYGLIATTIVTAALAIAGLVLVLSLVASTPKAPANAAGPAFNAPAFRVQEHQLTAPAFDVNRFRAEERQPL